MLSQCQKNTYYLKISELFHSYEIIDRKIDFHNFSLQIRIPTDHLFSANVLTMILQISSFHCVRHTQNFSLLLSKSDFDFTLTEHVTFLITSFIHIIRHYSHIMAINHLPWKKTCLVSTKENKGNEYTPTRSKNKQ
jgi:hypothetical protein